eukprot:173919-Rhodomonas_salina.1
MARNSAPRQKGPWYHCTVRVPVDSRYVASAAVVKFPWPHRSSLLHVKTGQHNLPAAISRLSVIQ